MRIGLASDHGGHALKERLRDHLDAQGHVVVDFGNERFDPADDYPDYVLPLACAVSEGRVDRGVAVCRSGSGAAMAANKVAGVRAAVTKDVETAREAVALHGVNVLCVGASRLDEATGVTMVEAFAGAVGAGGGCG